MKWLETRTFPRLWCVLAILPLPFLAGCIVIPSPSHETVSNKLTSIQPLQDGDTILIYGRDGLSPAHCFDPYFIMCGMDYRPGTISHLTKNILLWNPVPGRFAIAQLAELQGPGPVVQSMNWGLSELQLSQTLAASKHLRYVIFVKEKIKESIHVPLYIVPFGIAACGNTTVLEATLWELPSGVPRGTLTASSKGEFVGLAYMLHLIFVPGTQDKAARILSLELLRELTGQTPHESVSHPTAPSPSSK